MLEMGLGTARLKTGTPPRLDGRTIDWARLERQPSERSDWSMSALAPRRAAGPQVDCAITRTTAETHDIIYDNLHRSPLFAGAIEGRGPRYCPSIEDKVKRFAARGSHQIFLEPEGLNTNIVYPNGISSSLPADVQRDFIATIPGLERAVVVKPGYAVEYAHLDPRSLDGRLAHRSLTGLFLAGQINGTTGYEEAAAQGLAAGLNAAAHALDVSNVRFDRSSSYIGVMIDDLTLHGVSEPYRMMTARSEFRLHLRADNATTRLGTDAITAGCVSEERRRAIEKRTDDCTAAARLLDEQACPVELGVNIDTERRSYRELVPREDCRAAIAARFADVVGSEEAISDAEYAPYLARQRREWATLQRDGASLVPPDFAYSAVAGLSTEMIERLNSARPETLAQATRVRGVTPAALTALHFALARAA